MPGGEEHDVLSHQRQHGVDIAGRGRAVPGGDQITNGAFVFGHGIV
jgi:hypothetical protein